MNQNPRLQTLLPNQNRLSSTSWPRSGAASINFGKRLGTKPPKPLSDAEFMQELAVLMDRYKPEKKLPKDVMNALDTSNIDDTSLLLTFDISLQAKDGQEVRVKGQSVMDGILVPSAIPEAPDMVQSVHYTHIWRPLKVKIMDMLQKRLQSPRRLPYSEGSLSDYDANTTPAIPAGRQYTGASPTSLSAEPGET